MSSFDYLYRKHASTKTFTLTHVQCYNKLNKIVI
jgi:hypothetical protein